MGHFCWMCERDRPNEKFSGRNHRRHLCRDCARLPKSDRDRKDRLSALWDMLYQSNISAGNIDSALTWAEDPELASIASLVIDIGRVHPRKRKRMPHIRANHPELWQRMIVAGLVEAWLDDAIGNGSWEDAAGYDTEVRGSSQTEADDEDVPF